jgi:hypothetical protein
MCSRFEGFKRPHTHQLGCIIEPNMKLYHRRLAKSILGGVGGVSQIVVETEMCCLSCIINKGMTQDFQCWVNSEAWP